MCNLSGYMEERVTKRVTKRAIDDKMAELVLANLKEGRKPEEFAGYLGLTVEQVRDIEQKALAPA